MPAPDDQVEVLSSSVARLRGLVEPLDGEQLRGRAYPSKWSIADVLSHLGSGALIMRARIDAESSGIAPAEDFAQPIWAEWNAKSPDAQRSDALAEDRALLDRLASLTDDEWARFTFSMGPMRFDFPGFLGMRINEHALHTWDIEVALDPAATVQPSAVRLIVDRLGMIARFAGKPTGAVRDVHLHTTDPARDFTLALGADAVALEPGAAEPVPDLELPAEALVRLVYGRLDPDHTPATHGDADLDELRRVFPGV